MDSNAIPKFSPDEYENIVSFHRKHIATREQFEAFKAGESLDGDSMYVISDIAHPDVFAEVRHFANYPVKQIIFNNILNYVIINPTEKKVSAYLTRDGIGASQLVNLPIDYEDYQLYVEGVSVADIEAMEQWKSVKIVYFMVDNMPSEEILQRIKALNVIVHLSRFARMNEEYNEYFSDSRQLYPLSAN